jgi:hypothetical protein
MGTVITYPNQVVREVLKRNSDEANVVNYEVYYEVNNMWQIKSSLTTVILVLVTVLEVVLVVEVVLVLMQANPLTVLINAGTSAGSSVSNDAAVDHALRE